MVMTPAATLKMVAKVRPIHACLSLIAPLFLPPLWPEPPLLELPLLVGVVEGALGTNVALGLVKQELAAALALATDEGAFWLTVALPPKSQD